VLFHTAASNRSRPGARVRFLCSSWRTRAARLRGRAARSWRLIPSAGEPEGPQSQIEKRKNAARRATTDDVAGSRPACGDERGDLCEVKQRARAKRAARQRCDARTSLKRGAASQRASRHHPLVALAMRNRSRSGHTAHARGEPLSKPGHSEKWNRGARACTAHAKAHRAAVARPHLTGCRCPTLAPGSRSVGDKSS
jgi:hypothetical protein